MGDPISVRSVMASAEITERIQKTDAAMNQALGEEFAKELSRQERLRQTTVNENEESAEVKNRKKKDGSADEKKKHAKGDSGQDTEDEIEEFESEHIIDLQV